VPKNIVVCCDGTANEFTRSRTNVPKLFLILAKDPAVQVTYYHPGVGTMAPPGFLTKAGVRLAEIAGLAFGYGLSNDIRDAYIFIANHYERDDRLFLFGFSRGAYTVRAVTGLLHLYGLIPMGNEPLVPYVVRMMWKIHGLQKRGRADSRHPSIGEYFRLAREFKATYSRVCKPYFVGVWDTVSSVGWFANPLSLPFTANNPDIAIARHAVSIDEHRAFFRTNLWHPAQEPPSGPKDLLQVWFPGVHCDIGGGYPEPESGLSKISLEWMIEEAKAAGLLVENNKVELVLGRQGRGFAPPDPDGMLHESMTRPWYLAEYVPKPYWEGRTTFCAPAVATLNVSPQMQSDSAACQISSLNRTGRQACAKARAFASCVETRMWPADLALSGQYQNNAGRNKQLRVQRQYRLGSSGFG
jgi:uncharacterized protein (DUF2235 family)